MSEMLWVDPDSEWFDVTPWDWTIDDVCAYLENTVCLPK